MKGGHLHVSRHNLEGDLSPVSGLKNVFCLPRVLLRVRMLYYLRQEVIGDQAEKVLAGVIFR